MKSSRAENMGAVEGSGVVPQDADGIEAGMPGLAARTAQEFVPPEDLAGHQGSDVAAAMLGDEEAESDEQLVGPVRPSSSPVIAWGPNRLDVFVLGTDRALYHKW